MSDSNVWGDNLKDGVKGEKLVRNLLLTYFDKVDMIDYLKNPKVQKSGIDMYCWKNEEKYALDVKSRSFRVMSLNDILFEIETMINQKTGEYILGWLYTTKACLIAYVVFNEMKTEIIRAHLISITDQKLRDLIEDNMKKYPERFPRLARTETVNGRVWYTKNYPIKIKEFPTGSIVDLLEVEPVSVSGVFKK